MEPLIMGSSSGGLLGLNLYQRGCLPPLDTPGHRQRVCGQAAGAGRDGGGDKKASVGGCGERKRGWIA
jgi:hypothetical protein